MKNVYFYIVLFLFLGAKIFGQDLQNANYLFGKKAYLNFSANLNVTALGGSAMNTWETCASVSDQAGNLLFYTNGGTVWNKNHAVMTNGTGLYSNDSNTQGAVIVPKPGNSNIYYLVTIDGNTGNKRGLYYSEIDMSQSANLGSVTIKNVVMKDGNGIDINTSYSNTSEKITSTKHSNGTDYWIVTHIRGYIYSYQVTAGGIATIPITSNATVNFAVSPGASVGAMKISPDGQNIGICYSSGATANSGNGGVALGSFNAATGIVSFNTNIILVVSPYGIEFSPNSQNVYFTTTGSGGYVNYSGWYKVKSSGSQLSQISQLAGAVSLQLAIDNKIYLSKFGDDIAAISVINDPDNFDNPNFQDGVVSLGTGRSAQGLPQWVHWQKPCVSNLILTSTINDVASPLQDNRQASNSITASNVVNNGAVGVYHAGTTVVLKPGFYAAGGSRFRGYIEGCSNQYFGRPENDADSTDDQEATGAELATESFTTDGKFFSLSPNPASETVSIVATEAIKSILVTSIDGKTILSRAIPANATTYNLDVRNYSNGFYAISVVTENGEVHTQKLIKI